MTQTTHPTAATPAADAPRGAGTAAFVDVDETVITAKSMFSFLRSWVEQRDGDDGAYRQIMRGVHDAAARGVPRTEINRGYYRLFAGVPEVELLAAARRWYQEYRQRPGAFVAATLDELASHRSSGRPVVLVSGSFRGCLDPLAEDVGADLVLCSEPLVAADGTLTGEVARPMIGPNKAAAVAETIASWQLDAAGCYGYGDHASDLDMLRLVGRPAVVGGDPVLREHAARSGWRVLDAEPVGASALV